MSTLFIKLHVVSVITQARHSNCGLSVSESGVGGEERCLCYLAVRHLFQVKTSTPVLATGFGHCRGFCPFVTPLWIFLQPAELLTRAHFNQLASHVCSIRKEEYHQCFAVSSNSLNLQADALNHLFFALQTSSRIGQFAVKNSLHFNEPGGCGSGFRSPKDICQASSANISIFLQRHTLQTIFTSLPHPH